MRIKPDFKDLANLPGTEGRQDTQHGWLDLIRDEFRGLSVLDVGAGNSTTKARLPDSIVETQEPCEACNADWPCDLCDVQVCYHAVICNDVIEHVVDYGSFASELYRISLKHLFLTTPGASVTENKSPFHFHEFHPWEILQLLEAVGFKFYKAWGQKWAGPAEYNGHTPANLLTGVISLTRDDLLKEPYLHPIALLMRA